MIVSRESLPGWCAAGLMVVAAAGCRGDRTAEGLHQPEAVEPIAEPMHGTGEALRPAPGAGVVAPAAEPEPPPADERTGPPNR